MLRKIATLPNRMIQRRIPQRGYKLESALIVVCGILGAIGFGYVGTRALGTVEGGVESLRFEFIGAAVRPLVALVVLWIGYTVISHVLANVYNGRGPVSRLFRASAWSLVPIGLWIALRSVAIFVLFMNETIPAEPDGFGAEAKFQSIAELGLDTPIYGAVLLSGVLFAAWSWYLLSIGVAEAKQLSEEQARKVAAIPAGAVALVIVWMGLGALGVL